MGTNKNQKLEKVILIYSRPWFVDFYEVLASKMEEVFGYRVVFFSDYEMKNTYNISPIKGDIVDTSVTVENEYFDIIKRDRVLKDEPWEFATQLLGAYQIRISEFFERYAVQFVFSATIDQFAIDLCYRHCLIKKIPFIGYHLSVIPEYTLLTSRGERSRFRDPNGEEISLAIESIAPKSFRPTYIPQKGRLKIAGLTRLFANFVRVPYFFYKYTREKTYNYHFKSSYKIAISRINLSPFMSLITPRLKLKSNERFDIYIPLQLHPECNSEYWGRDPEYQDYEDLIYSFCKRHSGSFKICVKEHPNMVGLRDTSLYKRFEDLGVNIADVEEDNRLLIDRSTVVVTYNSSVGIEGLLYGASILCLGTPYYLTSGHISDEESMVRLILDCGSLPKEKPETEDLRSSICQTLSMSIRGLLPDVENIRDAGHKNKLEQKASYFTLELKKYFNNIVLNDLTLKDVYTYSDPQNKKPITRDSR